jgi:hypothetical protein
MMKNKYFYLIGLIALFLVAITSVALARSENQAATGTLLDTVRLDTARFQDLSVAEAASYGLLHGCVSSPEEGAMGVHYIKGDLVGDGVLDASNPEALIYDFKNGKATLVGVEYVAIAEVWDASHDGPPVLNGQLFDYRGSPNRYGIPAFYELHVWAWKSNPLGTFADWNPSVSCDDYTAEATAAHE